MAFGRADQSGANSFDRRATQPSMILNRQRRVRVSVRDLKEFVSRARHALRLPATSVTVCLVTNSEIARWNREYRGKSAATDVLSFPAGEPLRRPGGSGARKKADSFSPVLFATPDSPAPYLGDIAIAPEVARRNARRLGRPFAQEMRILILHGMLHLMGYDHETDAGEMDRRERRLRRALGLG
ncbi:MAG TPA: rRNA maturation RNase YbeY [Candidatus Cybelea sp.]|jgi:probable rRNA maturation factor|nr:rRNA maturation RNase YbeY [Candidatus Cybelea sp.]